MGYGDNYDYGESPLYKDDDSSGNSGHIGAFYFGPVSKIVEIEAPIYHFSVESPNVIPGNSETVNVGPVNYNWTVESPSVYGIADVLVDFVGIPRTGTSPMVVDFTASVKFQGKAVGAYTVQEYRWYFDYDNYPTTFESSSGLTISHVYNGYYGQKFSVKLQVVLQTSSSGCVIL